MKAITVRQPWAWAIFHGKDIENRTSIGTWRPAVGQCIAIHAGQRWSSRGAHDINVSAACTHLWPPAPPGRSDDGDYRSAAAEMVAKAGLDPRLYSQGAWSIGAVIGTVEVVDVHRAEPGCCDSRWAEYQVFSEDERRPGWVVHLVFEQPRAVEPIPCRGALGLWTVPDDIAARLA